MEHGGLTPFSTSSVLDLRATQGAVGHRVGGVDHRLRELLAEVGSVSLRLEL